MYSLLQPSVDWRIPHSNGAKLSVYRIRFSRPYPPGFGYASGEGLMQLLERVLNMAAQMNRFIPTDLNQLAWPTEDILRMEPAIV